MDTPAPDQLPAEGYHWAFTDRREKRCRQAEILYAHRTIKGDCELYAFDRSLPITWDEVHSWGDPVGPGPTTGKIAKIEAFAPVRISREDRDEGFHESIPSQIPEPLHAAVHKAWAAKHDSPRSADDVARKGGFTVEQIDEFGPSGWRESIEPRSPGDHFPGPEENEALALMAVIKDRLVEIEQHKYSELFDGEASALRSFGDKVARLFSQDRCSPAPGSDPAPVLFLDVDGVINVFGGDSAKKVAASLAQLQRVVDQTGCDIVLSSAWRIPSLGAALRAVRERLGYAGPSFVGATPDLRGQPRGLEIAAWLAEQTSPPLRWAVVDDDFEDMGFVVKRFVRTDPRVGIDETTADRLIELLTSGPVESQHRGEAAAQ